ncbi:MAG: GIY-YIG nuclease family protein [Rhizomicrobium sp.]|jgi:hypothetical protein
MDKARRKEIIRSHKDYVPPQGIFAVRCYTDGSVWVSASRNLEKQQNQIWFGLRQGGLPNARLQATWKEHGEAAFTFEILEEVKDDNALLIPSLLKEREEHWRAVLGATKVFG